MLNTVRHITIFDNHKFNQEGHKIDVIGCGAIGSNIAYSLGKLGISNIRFWDKDNVEEHNLPNQFFGREDLGDNKAHQCALKIYDGEYLESNAEHYEGQSKLGDVVFLCVDSMEQRDKIFQENIKLKSYVKLVIDCRIDPWISRIYTLNPCNLDHLEIWKNNMYEDTENNNSLCGTKQTLGPTAQIIANMAVINFIKWWREEQAFGEIIMGLNPWSIYETKA